uniref:Homocysteine-responsive endoplasmic reticulum-resident ubiquitin-like domain member 2 protein n=1 Tax=Cavia porcellus TaxID=10141 RepID=H0VLL7_CAVPO
MDQSGMEIPVTLIIKAPNQKYSDQTISCFLNWTVGKLKTHLSNVYPSKPLTKDQRLVYSGRLLPDHLQLKDILRKQDEYHMVHLVCTSRTPPSSPKASTNKENHETLASSSSSNVEHQFPGQAAAPVPAYPALSPLQMLWWQQVYAHQYYLQYQAAVSAQATLGAGAALPPSAQPLNLARAPGEEPAPAPNLDNQAANENVPVNAQGGPALNEDDFNRDWLDWVYTFSRAAILLSIVYFYSSFSRFVMVMGAMLLVYLHQAGWFPFRQEGQQRAPNNNIEINHDGQHANNVELEEMERIMDDGLEDESGEDTGEDTSTAQRPGLMASAWSFVTTFFTSLIPEGPPPVAN